MGLFLNIWIQLRKSGQAHLHKGSKVGIRSYRTLLILILSLSKEEIRVSTQAIQTLAKWKRLRIIEV